MKDLDQYAFLGDLIKGLWKNRARMEKRNGIQFEYAIRNEGIRICLRVLIIGSSIQL